MKQAIFFEWGYGAPPRFQDVRFKCTEDFGQIDRIKLKRLRVFFERKTQTTFSLRLDYVNNKLGSFDSDFSLDQIPEVKLDFKQITYAREPYSVEKVVNDMLSHIASQFGNINFYFKDENKDVIIADFELFDYKAGIEFSADFYGS